MSQNPTKPSQVRIKTATTPVGFILPGESKQNPGSHIKHEAKSKTIAPPSRCHVYVNDGPGGSWAESAQVSVISRFGASFDLTRECTLGTLIKIEVALAPALRAYDQDKEKYRVIALVQHCSQSEAGPKKVYHTNVIFVGKTFPQSYSLNPRQTYRLSSSAGDGTWNVTECSDGIKQRRYPRFNVELDVEIGLIHRHEKYVMWERTETQDIGSAGISVITTLPAIVGDKLKFRCIDLDFHALATVVKRRNYMGLRDVLHLKFVDDRFPVDRLLFSKVEGRLDMTPAR